MIATFDGSELAEGVFIESDTNPWIEVNGEPVDWTDPTLERRPCPCGESGDVVMPGVLDGMDTPEGVQRCDTCSIHDGDLDAAHALAVKVGGVVKFHQVSA